MALRNVSASQVTTFNRCKRKWHWEKIKGFRTAATRAMRRGTAIHYALEIYLKRGDIVGGVEVDIETGNVTHNITDAKSPEPDKTRTKGGEWWATKRYVEQVKHLLPKPEAHGGPKVMTEQQFTIPTLGGKGPPWLGYIDLLEENVEIKEEEDEAREFLPSISLGPLFLHRVNDYKTSSDIRRYAKTKVELEDDIQSNSYAKFVLDQVPEADQVACRWVYLETRNKKKVNTLAVPIVLSRSKVEANWLKAMELVKEMMILCEVEDTLTIDPNPEACGDFGGCPHKTRCGLSTLGGAFSGLTNKKSTKKSKEQTMGFLKNLKKAMPDKAATPSEETEATGILSDDAATRTTSDAEAEELTPKKKPAKKTAAEKKAEKEAKAAEKKAKAAEEAAAAAEAPEETEDAPEEPVKPKARKSTKKAPAKAGFELYINTLPIKGGEYVLLPELMAEVMTACGGEAEFWDLDYSGQKKALVMMAQEIGKSGKNIAVFSNHTYGSDVIPTLTLLAARVFAGVRI